jgi:hypothetical protein
MTRRCLLLSVLLLFPLAAAAQNCRPQLVLEPPIADQWLLEQLAAGQSIRIPFRIEIETNRDACPFLVGFDLVHSGQITAHVEQRPFSQPLLDISASDPRRLLNGVTGDGLPVAFDLDLVVTPGPNVSARRLNIQLTQRAYAGTDPANAVETDRVREHVRLDLPAGASLIVDSDAGERALGSGPGFLALGDLVSGAHGQARLTLVGNVDVTLNVTALHGRLIHTEFPEYSVPYSLSLGGVGGGSNLERRMRPGESTELDIDVGELESLVAGDYQDVVQITITTD